MGALLKGRNSVTDWQHVAMVSSRASCLTRKSICHRAGSKASKPVEVHDANHARNAFCFPGGRKKKTNWRMLTVLSGNFTVYGAGGPRPCTVRWAVMVACRCWAPGFDQLSRSLQSSRLLPLTTDRSIDDILPAEAPDFDHDDAGDKRATSDSTPAQQGQGVAAAHPGEGPQQPTPASRATSRVRCNLGARACRSKEKDREPQEPAPCSERRASAALSSIAKHTYEHVGHCSIAH